MVDIAGPELDAADRELLTHPSVGGVILFSRNYLEPEQLGALTRAIRALRSPPLLVAVDHEGGRVQRFREGFTALPAAAAFGRVHDRDPAAAAALAADAGWLMAAELRCCGVDMSFAPVLDLDRGCSQVIGDRAFHREPDAVTALARAWLRGMREAGMPGVGKHFPGHGGVAEDSHHALPVDDRDVVAFRLQDMLPFEWLGAETLAGVMTAHLLVPAVDEVPVSFSRRWLVDLLRVELGYQGAVFSDDLSMHGAHGAGAPVERARQALAAGCDMVLVCNDRAAAEAVIEGVGVSENPVRGSRLARFHARSRPRRDALLADPRRAAVRRRLAPLDVAPELDLHDDNPA
jgi:beta-N-acetylhexosaminidase